MGIDGPEVAVLFADITGSTAFYEARGNAAAARSVLRVVASMRAVVEEGGGVFVSAKGDDILCYFAVADDAYAAAVKVLRMGRDEGLSVHAGLQWGEVVLLGGDIFGRAVNIAARLCSVAKPAELVVAPEFCAQLSPLRQASLVAGTPIVLKGTSDPIPLHSYQLRDGGGVTTIVQGHQRDAAPPSVGATLSWGGKAWTLGAQESLTVGRSQSADIRVDHAGVSRRHGTVRVADGLVEYADHSTSGSFVSMADSRDLAIFRRPVILAGEGTITLGAPRDAEAAPSIRFVVRTQGA